MNQEKAARSGKAFFKLEGLKKAFPYLLISIFCVFFCWYFVLRHGVFGSNIDWINQHSVLPDYFRKRFYETGNPLPDMAWNLGGGQNIYHLSYYGLFSPVIWLSYALPFLRMDYYIMGSSMVCYIVSVLLFHYFLRKKNMPEGICFGTALFFALASPLIYHSYNQLMFVNYMPFLCLALVGTEDYLHREKKGCLLAGVTGMILTSFYFSIGGMGALCLYALAEYLEKEERITLSGLLGTGIRYTGNLLHGVLLSGILLVPTAVSILSSRQEGASGEKLEAVLSFEPLKILYTPYGMGLTVFAIVAVLGGIFCVARWQERIVSIGLVLLLGVPAVGFLLNGGLYDKGKVFIPFIPLVCLQCARYITRSMQERISFFVLLPWAVTGFLLYLVRDIPEFEDYREYVWLDFTILLTCFLAAEAFLGLKYLSSHRQGLARWKNVFGFLDTLAWSLILVISCIGLFGFDAEMNLTRNRMIPAGEYQEMAGTEGNAVIKEVLEKDKDFYRMERISNGIMNHNHMNRLADIRQNITSLYSSCYNMEYWDFRKNTFALNEPFRNNMMQSVTDNPCFLQLMGVRYLLTEESVAGYEKTDTDDILKSTVAAPLLYVTDEVIREQTYRGFSFPTNQTALIGSAVITDDADAGEIQEKKELPQMIECGFALPEFDTSELMIKKCENGYEIEVSKETEIQAKINRKLQTAQDNLFALCFDVENKEPERDMYIRLNGQTNRLTSINHEYANQNTNFTFLTTVVEREELVTIQLGAGSYRIRNIRAFTGNFAKLQNAQLYQSPVHIEDGTFSDDCLQGKAEISKAGYLITSIPYDENFTIALDGKEIEKQKVNTAFLGAKLPAGKHKICISYHAPGKSIGGMLSLAGILLLIIQGIWTCKKHRG